MLQGIVQEAAVPSESRCNFQRIIQENNIVDFSQNHHKTELSDVSDELIEEFENKQIRVLKNKVDKYLEVVTKCAQTNREKELRAK